MIFFLIVVEQIHTIIVPAAFILGEMHELKRILKVNQQLVRDGQRLFVYEQPKTGDIFTIADPDLRLDQLEEVQRDVAMLLENGLNPPVPAAEDPAPTAEPVATEDEPAIVQQ